MQTVTAFFKAHIDILLAAAIASVLGLFALSAMREHDARIHAEDAVKAAQSQIDTLQVQAKTVAAVAKQRVTVLKKQAATVKTPAQAVQAIPDLSVLPLNVRPAPSLPDAVIVDAVPLFKDLNQAKQDSVGLEACTKELDIAGKVEAEKDIQIEAWKRKPRFWKRVETTGITLGIGAALAYAAGAAHAHR